MKLTVGQQVRFIPLKGIRVFGFEEDNSEKTGVITYINVPHRWFLVEYDGIGCKLHSGYKFSDLGLTVFIGDVQPKMQAQYYGRRHVIKPYNTGFDKPMSLINYVAAKVQIMRELGVTPTDKEYDHLMSLDSEIKIDNAVKAILKKRWAQRNYK